MTALADLERAIRLWGETTPREVVCESLAERWPVGDDPRKPPVVVRYVVVVVRGV